MQINLEVLGACLDQPGPLFPFPSLGWTETENSQLVFFFFMWTSISWFWPQRPKPISQSSDGRGSFNSFPIGSEGEEIAPVGGWELEFWSSLCIPLNFPKLFNVYLDLISACTPANPADCLCSWVGNSGVPVLKSTFVCTEILISYWCNASHRYVVQRGADVYCF